MTKIRLLPSHLVNQIAAGEVVERPASVVKELVENSLDAGATHIEVSLRDGGASYLSIMDNGHGMTADNLRLCIERHATSKLPEDDLFNINTLGFRGEALPSIGAISRLKIQSRARGQEDGYSLSVEGGMLGEIIPVAMTEGTKIEVKDLFYAIPARLKFLRTKATEQGYVVDVLQRLSMIYPHVAFTVKTEEKTLWKYDGHSPDSQGQLKRISDIMGAEFFDNSLPVNLEREDMTLTGFVSLPTLNRSNAQHQFLFVNGRPVKDKLLTIAVKLAYQDFIAHDRYPLVSLFLNLPPRDVDVNVHPAKTEVRFKDINLVRSFLIGGLKQTLAQMGHRSSNTVSEKTLERFQSASPSLSSFQQSIRPNFSRPASYQMPLRASEHLSAKDPAEVYFAPSVRTYEMEMQADVQQEYPLGMACAQVHETYIVSQTKQGIVVTDQHAAHERIVYEKLKREFKEAGVKSQILLIPEVVKLSGNDLQALLGQEESLKALGFVFEAFGEDSVLIREVPAMLAHLDIKKLAKDLSEEITEQGKSSTLEERLNAVCSLMACHGSIRSGHKMLISEMNELLRQVEKTPYSGQCNHGRPTHIVLSLNDIEKLFERK
ncbi:MAG: DNA mismatch repair endonuclease MutL [Alphaproteobacteria bacterium]